MNLRYHFALVLIVVSCHFLTYANSEFRIINGVDWDIEDSQYLVAVNYSCENICVGSLLTMQKVVTAAHCVFRRDKNLFTIIAGVTDIRDLSATRQSRAVERADYPRTYNCVTQHLDIAVIKVTRTFDSSPTVQSISICEAELTRDTEMRVAGWGDTTKHGNPSPTLKSTILRVTSFNLCAVRYRDIDKILTPAMICAAGRGTDICDGDSGAPGVVGGTLCAVVSNSVECNHNYFPTIFTNINDPDVQEFISLAMTY
ncbi:trypsin delta-like [Eurosta solidaginis]|uniref:trypsin delta-like n=1 Tax=Eurosta solidaginis TaxID=178769 RepID=UPI003530FE4D